MDTLAFLSAPITVCLILSIMLSYFGNHILSRGIIFIDIAIAQIASLGTMIGILAGLVEGSGSVTAVSLLFTIIILAIFSMTKFERQRIPQEAIIGIIYGLGLGTAMLLAERIPKGSNYITKTITGNILWVTWPDIIGCLILFLTIGTFHYFLRKNIRKISLSKNSLPFSITKVRLYELFFYITFGIVIVKAVPIAGIFLVFILLIAPASLVTLFTDNWNKRLLWSSVVGVTGSVAGMIVSFNMNISNGPAIVCILGILAFAGAFWKLIEREKTENNAPEVL